jgi:hypothetical protein
MGTRTSQSSAEHPTVSQSSTEHSIVSQPSDEHPAVSQPLTEHAMVDASNFCRLFVEQLNAAGPYNQHIHNAIASKCARKKLFKNLNNAV